MRLLPVSIAVIVCFALFVLVLRRDDLLAFVGEVTAAETPLAEAEEEPREPVAIAVAGDRDVEAMNVLVRRSEAREVSDAVRVRGQTQAARDVVVAAETDGSIVSEPIRKGTFVETGQILCELDPGSRLANLSEAQARLAEARARVPEAEARIPEARARVAEAEARLDEARINQNAASRLSEGGFASQTQVAGADAALRAAEASVTGATTGLETVSAGIESAAAGVQAAEAGVEAAELAIAKLTIEAPFSGLLETDTAELGALLQPGSPCATIVQLDPIRLVGFVPEAQVDRVKVGADTAARLASGQQVAGRVTFVSRSADETTRTFRVEATVRNDTLALRDGQTVEMAIATDPIRAHLLPASSLTLDDEGTLGIRTVADGAADFMPVSLVRDTVEGVLLAGLPDALDVIVVGQEYVTDGVPVRSTYEGERDAGTRGDRAEALP